MQPDDPRHGTPRGYSAHRREGSEPCDACRTSAADYERQRFYDSHLGRNRLIPVLGTRRRIRALQAIGWSNTIIAAELGYSGRDALAPLLYDAEWITRSRANKIAELYDRLSMTPGPSNITRTRALRAGYAPPLAWTDIDDPNEEPAHNVRGTNDPAELQRRLDMAVVWRLVDDGVRMRKLTAAEASEAIRILTARGLSGQQIEQRYGLRPERYKPQEVA